MDVLIREYSKVIRAAVVATLIFVFVTSAGKVYTYNLISDFLTAYTNRIDTESACVKDNGVHSSTRSKMINEFTNSVHVLKRHFEVGDTVFIKDIFFSDICENPGIVVFEVTDPNGDIITVDTSEKITFTEAGKYSICARAVNAKTGVMGRKTTFCLAVSPAV
ncbi:MAG: hypothetical protein K6E13_10650 [Lachnospiraceae bacterium]|nr:hypothetical protein [Lachnospiraceae bacterium]